MTTYIALLRAINLAGKNMLAMSAIRDAMTNAGYEDVRTLLMSGNVVFRSPKKPKLDGMFLCDAFVRSAKEWDAIVANNPFPGEAKRDPGHLIMMALRDKPKSVEPLREAIAGREYVELDGRQLYLVYPDGVGRSKLTNALIEKKLGTRGTARNWNTVLKLQALARG
jgi:uncharacterized protein (DUF1697 family)